MVHRIYNSDSSSAVQAARRRHVRHYLTLGLATSEGLTSLERHDDAPSSSTPVSRLHVCLGSTFLLLPQLCWRLLPSGGGVLLALNVRGEDAQASVLATTKVPVLQSGKRQILRHQILDV